MNSSVDFSKLSFFGLATMKASSTAVRGISVRKEGNMLVVLVIATILLYSACLIMLPFPYTNTYADADNSMVEIDANKPFAGADGNIKLMGVVHNTGDIPLEVKLGVNITNNYDNTISTTLMKETTTYSRVLYPYSVSPFKFSINSIELENQSVLIGKPFILGIEKLSTPNYDELLTLDYNNIPVGEKAALVGTVKNTGPFDLHNVIVYASAHDKNMSQIDSVRSNVIPVIEPGQEMAFTAIPDPAIKSQVMYFSCAGVDMNPQMNKLIVSDNKFVKYDLEGPVAISDLKYINATDSISFGVKHYNPDGGPMVIKLAYNENSANLTPVSIILDGKNLFDERSLAKTDGKVLTIDVIIPPKDHEIQIEGISSLIL